MIVGIIPKKYSSISFRIMRSIESIYEIYHYWLMTFTICSLDNPGHNDYIGLFSSAATLLAEEDRMNSKQSNNAEGEAATQSAHSMTRRDFMRMALLTAGAAAVAKITPVLAGRGTTTRYPLRFPPLASPLNNFSLR